MRVILIVSMLVSFSAGAQTMIDHSGANIDPKILDVMMQTVSEPFKDPSSVQFRNVRPSKRLQSYCGEVNAKNGVGAYVGFMPFLFTPERQIPAPSDNPGTGRVESANATLLNPDDEVNLFALKNITVSLHGCTDSQGKFIHN